MFHKDVKKKLNEELSDIKFTKYERVLTRTHPKSMKERIKALWEKEITLPVIPLSTVMVLVIGISLSPMMKAPDEPIKKEERQIVEVGGNYYWSDLYEKAVAQK